MLSNEITSSSILCEDVALFYNQAPLFTHLTMRFPAGKWSCILGPSGVGKTSLLRAIASLTSLTAGKINFDPPLPPTQITYMAQQDLLLPWLSALNNTLIPAKLQGMSSQELEAQSKEYFKYAGLSGCENKYPHELSGGMRQRIALIRTLLANKPIVLMDEPFSAVDTITRFQLQTLAANLLRQQTVALVTHDLIEALRLADEIFVLNNNPATIALHLTLSSPTPRNLDHPDVLQNQAKLFHALKLPEKTQ